MGTFIGARLKGTVYSSNSFDIAVEGMFGASLVALQPFTDSSATTFGGGARFDYYLSAVGKNAWMLSPGMDFQHGTASGANWVNPNIDISYLHQFTRYFGLTTGLQLGATFGVSGKTDAGDSYSGHGAPDIGVYIGGRF